MSYEYSVVIFLLTEVSASRITNAILASGVSLAPNLINKTNNNKEMLDSRSDISSVLGLRLVFEEPMGSAFFPNLLQELEVPYFGGYIRGVSENTECSYFRGWFPKTKTISQGPYRTSSIGQVIEFPKKDNGIYR